MFLSDLTMQERLQLKKIAETKGWSLRRAAQQVFRIGLEAFSNPLMEVSLRPSAPENVEDERTALIEAYVREHWQTHRDPQLAKALGCTRREIRAIRLRLKLRYRPGRLKDAFMRSMPPLPAPPPISFKPPPEKQEGDQLELLIREHWRTKSDCEIGRLMDPPVSGSSVCSRRFALGLKMEAPSKAKERAKKRLRDLIDREEFDRLVIHEGYTMAEFVRLKNLGCTRERIRQLADELDLKHSLEDRAPEWKVKRRARLIGKPQLADKVWVAEQMAMYPSLEAFAAVLQIDRDTLRFFLVELSLSSVVASKRRVETVTLTCAFCKNDFVRAKSKLKQASRRVGGRPHKVCCSQVCAGKSNRGPASSSAKKSDDEEKVSDKENVKP